MLFSSFNLSINQSGQEQRKNTKCLFHNLLFIWFELEQQIQMFRSSTLLTRNPIHIFALMTTIVSSSYLLSNSIWHFSTANAIKSTSTSSISSSSSSSSTASSALDENGFLPDRNVYGEALQTCSLKPLTGYARSGKCSTGPNDQGTHTVCAQVTDEFLQYSRQRGNDLITPHPAYRFPGLKAGDKWCLCEYRWREAWHAGVAPLVVLEASHHKTLEAVDLSVLQQHELKSSKVKSESL